MQAEYVLIKHFKCADGNNGQQPGRHARAHMRFGSSLRWRMKLPKCLVSDSNVKNDFATPEEIYLQILFAVFDQVTESLRERFGTDTAKFRFLKALAIGGRKI